MHRLLRVLRGLFRAMLWLFRMLRGVLWLLGLLRGGVPGPRALQRFALLRLLRRVLRVLRMLRRVFWRVLWGLQHADRIRQRLFL